MDWVSINDCLPEVGKSVLVATERGDILIAEYTDLRNWADMRNEYNRFITFRRNEVTHWIPLPELPKNKKL